MKFAKIVKFAKTDCVHSTVRGGKNGPCEAGALIAVVNDYVFVDKIYSRDASGMGQAGTFWSSRSGMPESIFSK